MDAQEFKKQAYNLIDWIVDYHNSKEIYPVKSQVAPAEILNQLPQSPPETGEPFTNLFMDFKKIILPGITHWQHPSFFAYFQANNSFPSILGELLTAALGAQCMSWETSPAAAELEEKMMQWLIQMLGLPLNFTGVIQDTASTATLCSLLTAREKYSNYDINQFGFGSQKLIVYCSQEAHSSIEKAAKIAGLGKTNLRKIAVDQNYAMLTKNLEAAIQQDVQNKLQPLAVIAAVGTTGSTAIDPLAEIVEICNKYKIWCHVDAAYAGSALVLPENRWMIKGIENADSFVFNPHKWMFTNFDCSAYFVRDEEALVRTFEIMPEYLKTVQDKQVNNYRDWGIQLGRRFRALKLWFVIRSFGIEGIRTKIRNHIQWAQQLASQIEKTPDFELLAPTPLAVICFRFKPKERTNPEEINRLNEQLLQKLNKTGKLYLTHTKLDGKYIIRFVIGQTDVQKKHVDQAWDLIQQTAENMLKDSH